MKLLFDTISKMNKSEKLYFRRRICDEKTSDCIKIYDTIIKTNSSNPIFLNKKIKLLDLKEENYSKHQLLNKLLQSNLNYNINYDENLHILNEFSIILLLRQKNQISLARKKWNSLFEKCLEAQNDNYIDLLIKLKLNIELLNNQFLDINEHQKILLYYSKQTQKFYILNKLRIIYQSLLYIKKKTFIVTSDNKQLLKNCIRKIKQIPKANNEKYNEYFFLYNTSVAYIYLFLGKFDKAITYLEEPIKKISTLNIFLKNNSEYIIDTIRLYSDIHFFFKQYHKIPAIIKQTETITLSNKYLHEQKEVVIFLIKNRYYNTVTQYENVDKLYKENTTLFEQWIFNSSLEIKRSLLASLSIGYFISSNYQEALYYSSMVFSNFKRSHRQELISFFYLFELLISFEYKKNIIFESKYHNAYSHFYKYYKKNSIWTTFISSLHKIYFSKSSKEKQLIYQKISEDFNNQKSPSLDIIFTFFDIPVWIESKYNKINYRMYRKQLFKN